LTFPDIWRDPHYNVAMLRLDAAGVLDTTFGSGGRIYSTFGYGQASVFDAALDGAGRMLVAGTVATTSPSTYFGHVSRLNSNGAFDSSFGSNGMKRLDGIVVGSLAVLPDGKILAAGNQADANAPFVVFRLDAGGGSSPGPAGDLDGDGIPDSVESAEGRNPYMKDNDVFGNARLFAMQQYRDFLAREGEAGGITYWTNAISSGARSRGEVIENFFNSTEFQGTIAPVTRLYFAYFLRVPDYDGLNYWIGRYRGGDSLEGISNFFAGGAEFVNTYGALSNAAFVDRVYQNVLGRAPDAGGRAFWIAELDSSRRNRGQVMLQFSEGAEYRGLINNEVYVTMMYIGMLRRAPEPGGFSFWVDYLDHGNSGLSLINGFLGATEYHNRFLP
jgi:uncharacterized delta-60 repeat protein